MKKRVVAPEPATHGEPPALRGTLLEFEFLSDPRLLSVVRASAERLSEVLGFSADEQRSIVRALDEALSNILRHCYCGETDKPVGVQFRAVRGSPPQDGKTGLEIVLSDDGPPIDPAKLKGRALTDVRPGGLGLHLIRESMDVMEFSRSNGKNHLRLVKYAGTDSLRSRSTEPGGP